MARDRDYSDYCQSQLSHAKWLVGCFEFNGPLRQYFSLYRAVSQREGERGERIDESKNVQTTRTYCKRNRPLPYCNRNSRTPRHWKFTQHHRTTRPPPSQAKIMKNFEAQINGYLLVLIDYSALGCVLGCCLWEDWTDRFRRSFWNFRLFATSLSPLSSMRMGSRNRYCVCYRLDFVQLL